MTVPKTQYQVSEAYCPLALVAERVPWPGLRDLGRQIVELQGRWLGKGSCRRRMLHRNPDYDAGTRSVPSVGFELVVLPEA